MFEHGTIWKFNNNVLLYANDAVNHMIALFGSQSSKMEVYSSSLWAQVR